MVCISHRTFSACRLTAESASKVPLSACTRRNKLFEFSILTCFQLTFFPANPSIIKKLENLHICAFVVPNKGN